MLLALHKCHFVSITGYLHHCIFSCEAQKLLTLLSCCAHSFTFLPAHWPCCQVPMQHCHINLSFLGQGMVAESDRNHTRQQQCSMYTCTCTPQQVDQQMKQTRACMDNIGQVMDAVAQNFLIRIWYRRCCFVYICLAVAGSAIGQLLLYRVLDISTSQLSLTSTWCTKKKAVKF